MRNSLLLSIVVLCGAAHAAPTISADDANKAQDLAKTAGCLACHSVAEKIVGPAYSKVAEKYAKDPDAVETLVHSVQYGSKGKWGRIPMPAHADLSKDNLNLLVRWVLSIEKPQ